MLYYLHYHRYIYQLSSIINGYKDQENSRSVDTTRIEYPTQVYINRIKWKNVAIAMVSRFTIYPLQVQDVVVVIVTWHWLIQVNCRTITGEHFRKIKENRKSLQIIRQNRITGKMQNRIIGKFLLVDNLDKNCG